MSFHLFNQRHKRIKTEPLVSSSAIQRKSNSGQQTLNSDKNVPSTQKKQGLQSMTRNQVDNINVPSVVKDVISSEGKTLDTNTRAYMGSHFGHDFSQVRVHTDTKAAGSSETVNARAYTVGNHIVFNTSEYKPGTLVGDALIAHELAHVVQQQGASYSSAPMQKGETEHSVLEEDADISAVGTVVSLWGGAKAGLTNIAQNAVPRLRSGLRLQRCKEPPIPREELEEARKNLPENDEMVREVLTFVYPDNPPGKLSDGLRDLAAVILHDLIWKSDAMDYVPHPPGRPSFGWLGLEAVKIAWRVGRRRGIYETARVATAYNYSGPYNVEKQLAEGGGE